MRRASRWARACTGGALLLALLAGVAHADTSREAFTAALQKWQAAGVHDYAFTFNQSCFCIDRQPVRITVQNDRVQSAYNVPGGGTVNTGVVGKPLTLTDIFQKIEAAYAQPAAHIALTLNPQYGYPERVYIDYDERIADEELIYTISDFAH